MRQVASEGDAYSFLFNVTRAGTYELQVGAPNADGSVNGSVQVQGSPSSVIVRPGPLSAAASKVFGPSCPDGEPENKWCEGAGRPVRLWIEARDAFGNPHEVALAHDTVQSEELGAEAGAVERLLEPEGVGHRAAQRVLQLVGRGGHVRPVGGPVGAARVDGGLVAGDWIGRRRERMRRHEQHLEAPRAAVVSQ